MAQLSRRNVLLLHQGKFMAQLSRRNVMLKLKEPLNVECIIPLHNHHGGGGHDITTLVTDWSMMMSLQMHLKHCPLP